MAAYKLSFEEWVSGPIFMSKNGGAFEARTIPSADTEVWISSPYLRTHQILAWVLRFGKDRWTVRLIRNEGDCIHHLMLFKEFMRSVVLSLSDIIFCFFKKYFVIPLLVNTEMKYRVNVTYLHAFKKINRVL